MIEAADAATWTALARCIALQQQQQQQRRRQSDPLLAEAPRGEGARLLYGREAAAGTAAAAPVLSAAAIELALLLPLQPRAAWLLPPWAPPEEILVGSCLHLPADAAASRYHSVSLRELLLLLLLQGVQQTCGEGAPLTAVPFPLLLLGLAFSSSSSSGGAAAAGLSSFGVLPSCSEALLLPAAAEAAAAALQPLQPLQWAPRALERGSSLVAAVVAVAQQPQQVPLLQQETGDLPPHAAAADGSFLGDAERQPGLAGVYTQVCCGVAALQLLQLLAAHPQTANAALHAVGILWPERYRFLEQQLLLRYPLVPLLLRPPLLLLLAACTQLCRLDVQHAAARAAAAASSSSSSGGGGAAAVWQQQQQLNERQRTQQLARVCCLLISAARQGQRDILSGLQRLLFFFVEAIDAVTEDPQLSFLLQQQQQQQQQQQRAHAAHCWEAVDGLAGRPSVKLARMEMRRLCGVLQRAPNGRGSNNVWLLLSPELFLTHVQRILRAAGIAAPLPQQQQQQQLYAAAASLLWIELFRTTYQSSLRAALYCALGALPELAAACFELQQQQQQQALSPLQQQVLPRAAAAAAGALSSSNCGLLAQRAAEVLDCYLTSERFCCYKLRQIYGLVVLQHLLLLAWGVQAAESSNVQSRAFPLQQTQLLVLLLTDVPHLLPPAARALLYGSLQLLLTLPAADPQQQQQQQQREEGAAAAAAAASAAASPICTALIQELQADSDRYLTLLLLLFFDASQQQSSSSSSSVPSWWAEQQQQRPFLRGVQTADDPTCVELFGIRCCLPLAALRLLLLLLQGVLQQQQQNGGGPWQSGPLLPRELLLQSKRSNSSERAAAPAVAAVGQLFLVHLSGVQALQRQQQQQQQQSWQQQNSLARASCQLASLLCLDPHFAWGLQSQRLWQQQTALELLLSSPLLQQQARMQPVLPLLQQRCWSAAAAVSFGRVAVLLPPLGLLSDILKVIESLLTCFAEGPSAQLLQQLLLWMEQQGDLLDAPLQVCVHLAALWQQQQLLQRTSSALDSEAAAAGDGLQQKQSSGGDAAPATAAGTAATPAAAAAAAADDQAAAAAVAPVGFKGAAAENPTEDLLFVALLKLLRVYRHLLHAVIEEARARAQAHPLLQQQQQQPLLCFHTARQMLLKALLLLTAVTPDCSVGPDAVLLQRVQQQDQQQQQQWQQQQAAAQAGLLLRARASQQQQQQQQIGGAAGAAGRDSNALLLQLLLQRTQRLEGGPRPLHAGAAEGYAAAAAGCGVSGSWAASGVRAAATSSKLISLSPLLPQLLQQLPSLRLLCLLASRSRVAEAPQQQNGVNSSSSSSSSTGVYIQQHELSSIAFFAARLEAVVGGDAPA
ncbi:hypothetical protein ETH_00022105 [Eimeria tenella]|uniref:Uncharacterized protein n=1 Tax=Eimeria tenella TaxID=5802 RepID=U6LA71_EIMTE|nr:hypothetical protein ETH_00022105 [Eimeria tenella]CDJ45429.1 hypothetical protein ETH_00022105 [Eimeria tenella]|eukprot:XP_013236175.1 hypothetical protein ETH_00022105 [Eimeria tenella]